METNIVLFVENIYNSVTFDTLIKFIILYFFIIWISVLLWVMKDISNRTNNIFLQIFSVLIILFLTPFWIFIYLLIRPGNTLFEKYYKEIEENLDIFNEIIKENVNNKINLSPDKITDDEILNIDVVKCKKK